MKKQITVDYALGDEVCLRTEPGVVRIVTGYIVRPHIVSYAVKVIDEETWHFGLELEPVKKKCIVGFKK